MNRLLSDKISDDVCWGGSIKKRDVMELDRLMRRAGSVVGREKDPKYDRLRKYFVPHHTIWLFNSSHLWRGEINIMATHAHLYSVIRLLHSWLLVSLTHSFYLLTYLSPIYTSNYFCTVNHHAFTLPAHLFSFFYSCVYYRA